MTTNPTPPISKSPLPPSNMSEGVQTTTSPTKCSNCGTEEPVEVFENSCTWCYSRTNPHPPTAPMSAEDWLENQDIPTVLYGADDSDFDIAKLCEDYAAQEVANLQAENERLGSLAEEWAGKYHAATTENERLTQALAETVDDVKHVKSCLQRAYTETHENWIIQVLTIIDKPKYAGDFVYPEEELEGDHEFSY